MHPALEQGEEGLGGIDMDLATNIFSLGMRDRLMPAREREAQPMIGRRLVGHDIPNNGMINHVIPMGQNIAKTENPLRVRDRSFLTSICIESLSRLLYGGSEIWILDRISHNHIN